MVKEYIPRLAEQTLKRKLNSSGCVLAAGPKFSGKSTMCLKYAKTSVSLKTRNAYHWYQIRYSIEKSSINTKKYKAKRSKSEVLLHNHFTVDFIMSEVAIF